MPDSHDQFFSYIILAGIPVLAATAGFLLHHCLTKPTKRLNSTEALLAEICAAHRIRTRDQRLLSSVAERARLADSATLLAIPEVFDAAVLEAGGQKPFRPAQTQRIQQLRTRLFETRHDSACA